MSLFHLYAAVAGAWPFTDFPIIATQPLRYTHVAFVLLLSFLLFPLAQRFRNRVRWWDIAAGVAAAAILVYAIHGGEEFTDRARRRRTTDIVLGVVFIILLLEATRRTTGWIVPVGTLAFIAYAYFRPYLAAAVDAPRLRHRPARRPSVHHARGHLRRSGRCLVLADHPVHDLRRVPATFRRRQVLHRLLDGAHRPQAEQRRPDGGAGVVPARRPVGLGSRHHRDDGRRSLSADEEVGSSANAAGGLLAAGGLGAIISPPVLGAAAFLIAEFLKISYLDVIWMATIPTCLSTCRCCSWSSSTRSVSARTP